MEADRFDVLARSLTRARSRRGAMATVLGGTLGLLGLSQTEAKRRHKHKHKHKPKPKQLRQLCSPGKDRCSGDLECGTPTTRHTCSSSIPQGNWCCVQPGGSCTECDCCGDYYCEFDDNNQPHCVPNPEG